MTSVSELRVVEYGWPSRTRVLRVTTHDGDHPAQRAKHETIAEDLASVDDGIDKAERIARANGWAIGRWEFCGPQVASAAIFGGGK